MRTALTAAALSLFRLLPVSLRRFAVRVLAPTYVVGAVVVVRDARSVLLLRERHHEGWGLPGGLLGRREHPVDAAIRELREEIGLTVNAGSLDGPTVTVDPVARRVDVIFSMRLSTEQQPVACPPEVLEVGWFTPDALPELFEPSLAVLRAVTLVGDADD